ncbi:MAG: calcineurin-like phosphoesterase C-terminal domain-containing protein [Alistipes sp.]|nr:calcineurin-like phosphoesterase C-terminal domain-containing protein [Alistipes sp.]
MKRLLTILLLVVSILLTSCNPDSSTDLPPQSNSGDTEGSTGGDTTEDKEPSGDELVVNGTTIAASTTLYGLVTDAETGLGIKDIVVSDGFNCVQTDENGVYQLVGHEFASMVFLSTPAEYKVPVGGDNHPAFYKRLLYSNEPPYRNDFKLELLPGGKQSRFTMLALADPQVYDNPDVQRFINETLPDVEAFAEGAENPYAITLGDITGRNISVYWTQMKQAMARRNIVFFQCMGNHDHLNEKDHKVATTYWKSIENFNKYFGPQNYSFDRGDVHFVVIDNIMHGEKAENGGTQEYASGLYDWGWEWLLQDLSFVPKNKMVVLCCHIPFRDGGGGNHHDKYYRQAILEKLSEYKEAHLLIGHTHSMRNYIHKVNGKTIHEHIHGAVCGAMWHGTFNVDGTPNGYGVYEFDGTTLTNYWYKGTECNREFQMRLYDGGQVFYSPLINQIKTEKPNYFGTPCTWNLPGYVVANIWNIEHGDWEVTLWQNDKKVCDMTKFSAREWYTNYWFSEVFCSNGSYIGNSAHLYKGKLADKSAPFEVRAVDKTGRRGPYVGTTLTTTYDNVHGDFDTKSVE